MNTMTTQLELSGLKRDWIEDCSNWIASGVWPLGEFTTDDIHELYAPIPDHPNWIGCAIARLRCTGRIVEVGRRKSERPEANGRKVSVWKVKI